MKKASTYYFTLLAVANVFVAHVMSTVNGLMVRGYADAFEGRTFPALTMLFFVHPSWPYVFVVLFLVGGLLSLSMRWRSETLCHAVIVLLALEVFILFANVVAYALPFVQIITPLSKQGG